MTRIATVCFFLLAPLALAQRWTMQYFYDEIRTTLVLEDLAFPSAQRGVAAGTIYDRNGAPKKHVVMISSDGGEHWSLQEVTDHPRSLFFLNDSMGWMIADHGIWFTEESGRSWKKIGEQIKPDRKLRPKPEGGLILRVWFLDPQHGFAAGLQKTALETHDGGHSWTPLAEGAKPAANPSFTAYTGIAFERSKIGMIVGSAIPPRPGDADQLPPWMDPAEAAKRRRQVPVLTLLLQTVDGGASWKNSTAPVFGNVRSLRLAGRDGLYVMGFNESFEWPSEVYRLNLSTGDSTRVFREKNRRVSDSALFVGPRIFLAAVEPPGQLNSSPIPGKVKILTSANFTDWKEMDVDYKAVARSVILAGPDADHLWCATDTGMILHLAPSKN
jgi:hypothetical protein